VEDVVLPVYGQRPDIADVKDLLARFQRCMLFLWNSLQWLMHLPEGCWFHASDTKLAPRIKTRVLMRFITKLQRKLYAGNRFPDIRARSLETGCPAAVLYFKPKAYALPSAEPA
jgi:hypothetical protein